MTIISKKFKKGIILQGESSDSSENEEGSLFHNSSDGRIKSYVEGAVRQIVTNSQSQVLTNKILSGPNIEVQNPFRLDVKKDTKAALQSYASSASNGQLCFAIDSKQMFQVIDGVLKSVGGGGADNVSSLLIQTFDEVEASDFVQTGLVIVGTDTINGERSARLIHQAGTSPANDQSFKQTIIVDRKFRGNSMQLSLAIQSTAAQGNVTLKVYDETNSANIIASEQITTGSQIISGLSTSSGSPVISGFNNVALNSLKVGQRVTGSGIPTDSIITAVNSSALTINIDQNATASATVSLSFSDNIARKLVNFTIPQNCASLSYTTTALPESGSPETYIDDIVIELSEAALLETSVVTPNVTAWQGYTPTFQGFGSPSAIEFEWRQVGENAEIRGKFTSGAPTAVEARVGLPAGLTSAGTSLIPSISNVGIGSFSSNATTLVPYMLIEPSVTYLTLGYNSGATAGLTKQNGNALISNGVTFSFFASVPCSGLSATTTKTIPLTQSGLVQNPDSMVRLSTPNGRGSTNIAIHRFSTIEQNLGTDIIYQDSATNGASFTIVTSGVYSINFTANNIISTDSISIGISKNSSQLSTGLQSINSSDRLSMGFSRLSANTSQTKGATASWTGYLTAGDIIRPHGDLSNLNQTEFTISRQGSLKQIAVSSDQKLRIPTSELRFEGASARGTSPSNTIVKFDNIAKIRGDAFTINNDPVLGTSIVMKKAGKLDVSTTVAMNAIGSILAITKNQTVLTSYPLDVSEIIASTQVYNATAFSAVAASINVNVNDIIRIVSSSAITSSSYNSLNLSFQEQDISVSVTNTLPQFSESDSSVRVDTANGYGSTASNKIRRFSNLRDNIGSDITYLDDPANGATFTVKSSGIYNISYNDNFTTPGVLAVSKNASSLTTSANSLPANEVLALSLTAANNYVENLSVQAYLVAGDIIRAHTDGLATGTGAASRFTISKVGKPNVTGVNVTPFVNLAFDTGSIGEIKAFAGNVDTNHFLDANGTAVSRTVYADLFTKIGTTYGSGDGSTTFNLPDLRGVFLRGLDAGRGLDSGRILGSYQADAFQGHSHSTSRGGGESNADSANLTSLSRGLLSLNGGITTLSGYSAPRVADETRPKNIAVNYGIRFKATNEAIITPTESFSTDTASLTYAGSAIYTLSTLQNAPVGTYITFTYAANTNTRTQTTTRPTQTDADMNVNGILLYTRAYNAASSGAQPAAIAIQIGKGLKGVSSSLYKSSGKNTAGNLDYYNAAAVAVGARINTYNESTGVLVIDAGYQPGNITSALFSFSDVTDQTSGYLVINASKSPALTGVPLIQPRIATLSDVKASGTNGGTATSGSYQTRTLNTLSDPTGIVTSLASNQFTLPAGEYYIEAESSASFVNGHKAKLRNITDSADTLIGTVEFSSSAAVYASTPSRVKGNVVISSSKVFEIQHIVETTRATNGFGIATAAFGDNEVYSIVKITKVK